MARPPKTPEAGVPGAGVPEADRIHHIPLASILVADDRYRKEMGDIASLAESIRTEGQLVPIIIDSGMKLIAGERRLRAHKEIKATTIKCIILQKDSLEARIIELIENLERKEFTWEEHVAAMESLHELMQRKYGPKWSGRKTAQKVGLAIGGVSVDLQLAKALKEVPDVFEKCRTKEQALKALKKFQIDEAMTELALRKSKKPYTAKARNILLLGDARHLIRQLPESSVNLICSDPPYGIDFSKQMFHASDEIPPENKDSFDDSAEYFESLMLDLIPQFDRVLKADAGIFLFCAFDFAKWLIEHLRDIGFYMDMIPGIWLKAQAGRTNVPERYMNRAYEFFVYGTRGNFTLVKLGTPNVIACKNVQSLQRDHPTQKPVELMDEILQRMALPGHTILDPFSGVASTGISAIKKGCVPVLFELDEKYYNVGLMNLAKALELKDAGMMKEAKE